MIIELFSPKNCKNLAFLIGVFDLKHCLIMQKSDHNIHF
jgi:hypothetical protein